MLNENSIEIINKDYIIEIDNPQYNIFTDNTINIDYNYAANKPQINSIELVGNKSSQDLGLVGISDITCKEDIANKVSVLNVDCTDLEYPSAKCVNSLLLTKSNIDLTNLSEIGELKFLEKANISLDNLDQNGQAKFANPNLDNLSQLGEAVLNAKANIDFSNLTSNAKKIASRFAVPSENFINLTLGANGTKYTAPANGWFYLFGAVTATHDWASLVCNSKKYAVGLGGGSYHLLLPVASGTVISLEYSSGATPQTLRFIYAEGEVA